MSLAEVLCARLCHDLAGQLATVLAALEVAAEEETEGVPLATAAARALTVRLRFLRAAWAGGAGPMNAAELAALAEGVPLADRLRIDLSGIRGVLPDAVARLALCVLPVVCLALPRGGSVWLEGDRRGLVATLDAGTWPDLKQATATARGIALPLLLRVAAAAGWRVTTEGMELRLAPV